jgi:outer membrane lipoprotein
MMPKSVQSDQVVNIDMRQAQSDASCQKGKLVRWGGAIISNRSSNSGSRIEILAKQLSASARPSQSNDYIGRFIAESSSYIEPAIFKPGKSITILGEIMTCFKGKIDERDYVFPVVKIKGKHLWQEQKEHNLIMIDPFFRPYPYPYPNHWHPHIILKPKPKKKIGGQ